MGGRGSASGIGGKQLRQLTSIANAPTSNYLDGKTGTDKQKAYAEKLVTMTKNTINKKISESYDYAQFELCNPIDFDDLKLPKRKMFASICTFEYRNTCPYRGEPVSSSDNVPYEERVS